MPVIAAVIVVAVAGGVLAERRWGARAGSAGRWAMSWSLRTVVPVVVFFNLARLEIDAGVGGGIVLAWVCVAVSGVLAHQGAQAACRRPSAPSLRLPPPVAAAVALRLLVAPALLLAVSAPLIDLPAPCLIAAAMPAGLNGLIVAHEYGLDLSLAAAAIAWGTAIVVPAVTIISVIA